MNNYKVPFRRPMMEALESRALLSGLNTPWPDARSLSVSFAPDDVAIGPYRNSLREVFDQVADRKEWQTAVLRAFQTWSVHGDFNVSLASDRGDDFGAVGLTTGDPRFGEFRVGAFPQPGVLANALPYSPLAGSWSGDIFLNTQVHYFLGDWESGDPIDVPDVNEKGPAVELFSVLLHEAGNALGLEDNQILGSVMNGGYSGPNGVLQAGDREAIQQLYGKRQDPYEERTNDRRRTAQQIVSTAGLDDSGWISIPGSLSRQGDVDYYSFRPAAGEEKVFVRLRASGISLVKARLEVQDRFGNKIADVKADDIFDNNLQLEIGSLKDHRILYVRVSANTEDAGDVFAIGDYRLELDYRPADQQPDFSPLPYDRDQDDDDDDDPTIDFYSIDDLFAFQGLIDDETGENDGLISATPLQTTTGFLPGSRYDWQSSLASSADRDFWTFQAPGQDSPTLSIQLDPVGLDKPLLDATLLNADGDRVLSRISRNSAGGVSLVVDQPEPGQRYVLLVQARAESPQTKGNYVATVNFATNSAMLRDVYAGRVETGREDISRLHIAKTQLFRFDLLADRGSDNDGVQLSLYDADTGLVVASWSAASGTTRTQYVWLASGDYYVRAESRTRPGGIGSIAFQLRGDSISDDQGPNPIDPTQPPEAFVDPDWIWESLPPQSTPVIIDYFEPLFRDPWSTDRLDSFYAGYYQEFLA